MFSWPPCRWLLMAANLADNQPVVTYCLTATIFTLGSMLWTRKGGLKDF